MLRNSMSNGGQLHCGGMVSIIVEHLSLHLPNKPTDIILGRTSLSIDVIETMHLFHCNPNGDVPRRPPTTIPQTPAPTVGASSSFVPIPFPEHNIYMGKFAHLDHHYTSL
ncbi:unnamed protein product [Lactuca saligna]|uniref:Uncharacterized protein n=1 Tax=Lactuca saligna TaxID=75948 RepID=A0AA35ZQQ6_LACSI|nr:unnamed protein product [Lactuca saligna]